MTTMTPGTPRGAYFAALVRYETELWDAVDTFLTTAPGGISLARFEVLRVVDDAGPACRVSDIVAELRITVGAVSKFVDRLQADGLVDRRPNPNDGRSMLITLTEPGSERLATARIVFEAALSELVPESDDAVIRLTDSLRSMREVLSDLGAVPSDTME